ncbi:hypothetical protein Pmar_PMAR007581 [Perkinsus marinus ATCC 50983]|uniref:Uncharacterized protein n=1 Tax=Perkinsus marinus (strain ATCC 50983 / TXsc) TaxID=423536 RepID=C5L8E8_PERM5|nr:hypothetical protein Pmar_PMAR007581 [Perkinsus marinus ATCC 50983]EER06997.1 hypothetical protein Pmar_PMAR007581 [Perkinsus marinus ATCC 50983]|eukprot:XP_002775181.1 hypothetical protein Pmar_PMAR007581 [Perkinsus marinus ATCC 50983]
MLERLLEYLTTFTSKDSVYGQIVSGVPESLRTVLMFLHIIAFSVWGMVFFKDCFIKAPKPPVLSETLQHKKTK